MWWGNCNIIRDLKFEVSEYFAGSSCVHYQERGKGRRILPVWLTATPPYITLSICWHFDWHANYYMVVDTTLTSAAFSNHVGLWFILKRTYSRRQWHHPQMKRWRSGATSPCWMDAVTFIRSGYSYQLYHYYLTVRIILLIYGNICMKTIVLHWFFANNWNFMNLYEFSLHYFRIWVICIHKMSSSNWCLIE